MSFQKTSEATDQSMFQHIQSTVGTVQHVFFASYVDVWCQQTSSSMSIRHWWHSAPNQSHAKEITNQDDPFMLKIASYLDKISICILIYGTVTSNKVNLKCFLSHRDGQYIVSWLVSFMHMTSTQLKYF